MMIWINKVSSYVFENLEDFRMYLGQDQISILRVHAAVYILNGLARISHPPHDE